MMQGKNSVNTELKCATTTLQVSLQEFHSVPGGSACGNDVSQLQSVSQFGGGRCRRAGVADAQFTTAIAVCIV
jgi:hypothetical protein